MGRGGGGGCRCGRRGETGKEWGGVGEVAAGAGKQVKIMVKSGVGWAGGLNKRRRDS